MLPETDYLSQYIITSVLPSFNLTLENQNQQREIHYVQMCVDTPCHEMHSSTSKFHHCWHRCNISCLPVENIVFSGMEWDDFLWTVNFHIFFIDCILEEAINKQMPQCFVHIVYVWSELSEVVRLSPWPGLSTLHWTVTTLNEYSWVFRPDLYLQHLCCTIEYCGQ